MDKEQARKIAESIVTCVAAAYGNPQTVGELKQKCIEILTSDAAPVEREYRAGEWVSALRESYFVIDGVGDVGQVINCNDDDGKEYQVRGNAFPTEAIAKSAKAHADWWREFDLSDDGGEFEIYSHGGLLDTWSTKGYYGNPKFTTKDAARAAIERLGGEQKVIEMLNKGRVFRFNWGGQ